jgi:hypothetical protein
MHKTRAQLDFLGMMTAEHEQTARLVFQDWIPRCGVHRSGLRPACKSWDCQCWREYERRYLSTLRRVQQQNSTPEDSPILDYGSCLLHADIRSR